VGGICERLRAVGHCHDASEALRCRGEDSFGRILLETLAKGGLREGRLALRFEGLGFRV